MKLVFMGAVILLSSFFANAQTEVLPCDSTIGYRPGGQNLIEASHSFRTQLEILLNGCEVQKLVDSKDSNFYIRSFSAEDGKQTLKYDKYVFEEGKEPKEFSCILVAMPALKVSLKHACTDKKNLQNFVCQKGWIDCMPGAVPKDREKYCSNEYKEWSKVNCGGAPQIAM